MPVSGARLPDQGDDEAAASAAARPGLGNTVTLYIYGLPWRAFVRVHGRWIVKVLITVVAFTVLIVEPARAESAIAFVQSGRDYTAQEGASRDARGSWQCYPSCEVGHIRGGRCASG